MSHYHQVGFNFQSPLHQGDFFVWRLNKMDTIIVLLFLVLWGVVMKALIKSENNPEPYEEILFYVGLIMVVPYMVFLLLGGKEKKNK